MKKGSFLFLAVILPGIFLSACSRGSSQTKPGHFEEGMPAILVVTP